MDAPRVALASLALLLVVACWSTATTPRILRGPPPAHLPCNPGEGDCYGICIQHSGGTTCEATGAAPTAFGAVAPPDAGARRGPTLTLCIPYRDGGCDP